MIGRHPWGGLANDSGIDDVFNYNNSDDVGSNYVKKSRKKNKSSRASSRTVSHHRRKRRGLFGLRRRTRRTRRTGIIKVRSKGVKYTKHGQPYIILKSGKARFIKGRRHK